MEWLQIIHDGGKHLLALINDILDLSKVDAGKLSIERIEFSPVKIVEEVCAILRAGGREGAAARVRGRSSRAAHDSVGPHATPASGDERRGQCHQIHAKRARANRRATRPEERVRSEICRRDPGHGHWNTRRKDRFDLRPVHTGRLFHYAAIRRHGPGPCHQPPPRRAVGRRDLGVERIRVRHDVRLLVRHGSARGTCFRKRPLRPASVWRSRRHGSRNRSSIIGSWSSTTARPTAN